MELVRWGAAVRRVLVGVVALSAAHALGARADGPAERRPNILLIVADDRGGAPAERPGARGFTRSFALVQGGAAHFALTLSALAPGAPEPTYLENDAPVAVPKGFLSSDGFTDKLFGYLDADRTSKAPLMAKNAVPPPLSAGTPAWSSLPEERARQARVFEAYAAAVESLDDHVGKLVGHLSDTGELERTFDLESDPSELRNLADGRELAGPKGKLYAQKLAELRRDFDAYVAHNNVIELGRDFGDGYTPQATSPVSAQR